MTVNIATQMVQDPPAQQLLRCSKCGELKAPEEFHKDKNKKTGRCTQCKPCRLAAISHNLRNKNGCNYIEPQFISVIREMAVMQYLSDQANRVMECRIEKLRAERNRVVEKVLTRQVSLRGVLVCVCKKLCGRADKLSRACLYGSVRYAKGEMRIKLHPRIAWENRGKP